MKKTVTLYQHGFSFDYFDPPVNIRIWHGLSTSEVLQDTSMSAIDDLIHKINVTWEREILMMRWYEKRIVYISLLYWCLSSDFCRPDESHYIRCPREIGIAFWFICGWGEESKKPESYRHFIDSAQIDDSHWDWVKKTIPIIKIRWKKTGGDLNMIDRWQCTDVWWSFLEYIWEKRHLHPGKLLILC